MSAIKPATVDVAMVPWLICADGEAELCPVRLQYDPDDPWAVTLRFGTREAYTGDPVMWAFARELLAGGLHEVTGIGDVRVWPWVTPGAEHVAVSLSSPDGTVVLKFERRWLLSFLHRTNVLVPPGEERMDLDAMEDNLLRRRRERPC